MPGEMGVVAPSPNRAMGHFMMMNQKNQVLIVDPRKLK
jgi:hypothetical protein